MNLQLRIQPTKQTPELRDKAHKQMQRSNVGEFGRRRSKVVAEVDVEPLDGRTRMGLALTLLLVLCLASLRRQKVGHRPWPTQFSLPIEYSCSHMLITTYLCATCATFHLA
ncbi:hypothetical protein V6Z12_A09G165700 [Gossypium hirsutum]